MTPFVLESEYPNVHNQDVPWWWKEDHRNLREREQKVLEQREVYKLQTVDGAGGRLRRRPPGGDREERHPPGRQSLEVRLRRASSEARRTPLKSVSELRGKDEDHRVR